MDYAPPTSIAELKTRLNQLNEATTIRYPSKEADPDGDDARRSEKQTIQRQISTWQSCSRSVPRRYRSARFTVDNAPAEPLAHWMDEYTAEENGSNLVILGQTGTGKSWSVWAALRDLALRGAIGVANPRTSTGWSDCAVVVSHGVMLDGLRPDGRFSVDDLADTRLLVIEDIGSVKTTEWAAERVAMIIDYRWEQVLPTWVTSNLTAKDLTETLGERTFGRISSKGACVVVMSGEDRRHDPED